MSELREYVIKEIAHIIDCEHKTAPLVNDSMYLSVRTSNISNGGIDYESCNRVSEETYRDWTKREIPTAGDIILAREAPVGEVGIIKPGYKVCLGQRTVLIRVDNPEIHNTYLLYYLVNPANKSELIEKSGGSVVSHLNMKDIRAHSIRVPELEKQTAIASILSSLDDKINLLHRQNATLEKMAETLFRKWFVEEADEEWEYCILEDLCSQVNSGGTPSTKIDSYYNGSINWYSTKELNDNFLFESKSKITYEGLNNSSAKLFPKGTVLIAIYAAPTVGRLGILGSESAFNQAACGLVANENLSCKEFLYLYLKNQRDELNAMASGSAQQNLNVSKIKNYTAFIPDQITMDKFKLSVIPIFKKMESNTIQIGTLTSLRDTLLPKLMSGEAIVTKE